jgi:SSS family solute:Na+ symporter
VIAALFCIFRWDQIVAALANHPPGHSMLNPFDSLHLRDFNIWFVLLGIFTSCYAYGSWQGGHAFKSSAASPHEAKMANILGNWRNYARGLMFVLLALCAYTFMHHADFAAGAQQVTERLSGIEGPALQTQMRVPVALAHLLPTGVRGILAAILLFAMLACDSSYLHSWGSIFVQDVLLPLRKKALEPAAHLRLLRWAIAGVAVFIFLFSLFFKQTDYILMFFAITGAIYSGAGAVIVGGLYWRKGTTAAAWVSLLTGSTLAVTGLVIRRLNPDFPINGVWMQFIAQLAAITTYVVVSLLTHRRDYDLDKLLHRGAYAVEGNTTTAVPPQKITWGRLAGFDAEFTRGDKWIAGGLFAWTMFWLGVFFVGLIWNFAHPWPTAWWANYWWVVGVLVPFVVGLLTTFWFTFGGLRDLRRFFIKLATVRRDARDDGRVRADNP